MQTLLKRIRTYLNMSQLEVPEHLNVTFATVNRWENGRAIANKLAQSKLYELCKKAVPVYDMMLQRVAETAAEIPLPQNRILLYHGSKSGITVAIEPSKQKTMRFWRVFVRK